MTTEEFLETLTASNLLDSERMARLERRVARATGGIDPAKIAKGLVDADYITLWQAKQLLCGNRAFYLGRYKLLDQIGQGGMGVVFKAQHAVMDRVVALKVMSRRLLDNPRAVSRFDREVRTAAKLNHPNIIAAYDADAVGSTHFLVMEFAEGHNLNEWLQARGKMPIATACECAMQVAEGLGHAHRQGMVHRDIKLVNLLLTWNEETDAPVVKILDMGLARFVSEAREDGQVTRSGQTIGTPDYIAPEAAQNFKTADIRADIFSLGCSLFKLLSGRVPYGGSNTMEKLMARTNNDAPPIQIYRSDIPDDLNQIIAKMLARDPADRYQTPGDVVEALSPYAASVREDQERLDFLRGPLGEDEVVTLEDLQPEADANLSEFISDFSAAPVRDEGAAPLADGEAGAMGMIPAIDSPPLEELDTGQLTAASSAEFSTLRRNRVRSRKRVTKSTRWDSPLMLVGGGGLALLILGGAALYWGLTRQTGDQAFRLAEEDYRAGAYSQAINKYNAYLERHSGHEKESTAVVHRGLAQIRRTVESSPNFELALTTTQTVLDPNDGISAEKAFPEARGDLADLLPRIAEGLAARARAEQSEELVAATNEALALVEKFVPTALRPGQKLEEIQQMLELTSRELARTSRLDETIAQMESARDSDQAAEAYTAFRDLVRDYPDLEAEPRLIDAVHSVSDAQRAATQYVEDGASAITEDAQRGIAALTVLSARTGSEADAGGERIYALIGGSIYGLNPTDGSVLWRRFVGFDVVTPPVRIDLENLLVVESQPPAISRVEAATGTLRWRAALDGICLGQPILLSGRVVATSDAGTISVIDSDTGARRGMWRLPQSAAAGPSTDRRGDRIYQLAEHSNLFVIDADSRECVQSLYLGHQEATIDTPPVIAEPYVLVAENRTHDDSVLRVLDTNADGQLYERDQIGLRGHVRTSPIVRDGRVVVVTDLGAVSVFQLRPQEDPKPLVAVAESSAADANHVIRYPCVAGDDVWYAGKAITRTTIRSARGQMQPQWILHRGDAFLQPPEILGKALTHVRRLAGGSAAVVSAVDPESGQAIWQTRLSAKPVGEPIGDGNVLTMLSTSGAIFEIPTDRIRDGGVAEGRSLDVPSDAALGPQGTFTPIDEKGYVIWSKESPATALSLYGDRSPPFRKIALPGELSAPPAPFQGGLLLPVAIGQIAWVDAESGARLAEPFQVRIEPGQNVGWQIGVMESNDAFLLANSRGGLYRVGIAEGPPRHLKAITESELDSPIDSKIAITGNTAYAVDEGGTLIAMDPQELSLRGEWPLNDNVAWGPSASDEMVYVATRGGSVLCLNGAAELAWQIELPNEQLVGNPVRRGDELILATNTGNVARVAASDGKEVARIDLGQPLVAGPFELGGELVVMTDGGNLLRFDVP